MLRIRVVIPPDQTGEVLAHLADTPAACNVICLSGAAISPPGDLVVFDIAREAANPTIAELRSLGLHHSGSLTIDPIATSLSDAAAHAEEVSAGDPSEAVIWEAVEARIRASAGLSWTYLVFMGVASVIAGVGILTDLPVLIVGAMVVGPEYGPLAGMMFATLKGRRDRFAESLRALLTGFAVAVAAAAVLGLVVRAAVGNQPPYTDGRGLTRFIFHPDGYSVVVALVAGLAGAVSLVQERLGTMVGVLISVTTIPAAAGVGVACAFGSWSELWGSAVQLAINLVCLFGAGWATLAACVLRWPLRSRRTEHARGPSPPSPR